MALVQDEWRSFFAAARIVTSATERAEQLLRLHTGSGFNTFDWIEPTENRLSDILRDLLDPRGDHGQGDVFLRLALEKIVPLRNGAFPVRFDRCVVAREAHTRNGRRLDLLLDFGNMAIGIENKPFAGESPDQLNDYASYLSDRFRGEYCLIFLHGPGMTAQSIAPDRREALETTGRFRSVPYMSLTEPSLHHWLNGCVAACRSEKVRWFLIDFAEYVANQFNPP